MHQADRHLRALEDRYAYEQDRLFVAEARRNSLLGFWAASLMGESDPQAYSTALREAAIADPAGIARRLREDFDRHGVAISDEEIQDRMVLLLNAVASEMASRR